MQCRSDTNCPHLYFCNQLQKCEHQPLYYFCPELLLSCCLVPMLLAISNRVGLSGLWLVYPISMAIMEYTYSDYKMAPVLMTGGFLGVYLALREKGDTSQKIQNSTNSNTNTYKNIQRGPAVNFYVVSIALPVLIVSLNLGLIFSQTLPLLYISILAIVVAVGIFIAMSMHLKDIRAEQKIVLGLFKKMLPSRLQNSRKSTNLQIQMTMIQQADSQYDQHDHMNQLSPTRKQQMRSQLLQKVQNQFPLNQFVVCLLCFLVYECLCISLPEFVGWLFVVQTEYTKLSVSYGFMLVFLIVGELYLFKFYIQPTIVQQQFVRTSLGLKMDGVKMVKICLLGFLGGFLEGLIGFGFSYILMWHLMQSGNNFKQTLATSNFMNIFIGAIVSLSAIFCGSFHWLQYIIIFLLTLTTASCVQFLFNSYIYSSVKPEEHKSHLMCIILGILVLLMISILTAIGMQWTRMGFDSILQMGSLPSCK